MRPQLYYWETFTTIKRDQIYLNHLVNQLDHTERCLNIFAAISASTAIAGWALWQHVAFVWAFIIALSQVYAAVKNHLPFGMRLKALNGLYPEIEALALQAESDWFKVSRGELDEQAIIDLATKLKQNKITATQRHLKNVVAPEKKKIATKANEEATAYMASFMEV